MLQAIFEKYIYPIDSRVPGFTLRPADLELSDMKPILMAILRQVYRMTPDDSEHHNVKATPYMCY